MKYFRKLLVLVLSSSLWFSSVESGGYSKIQPRTTPLWNETVTDKLRQDLLNNYDKFSRPAQHTNTTTVEFSFTMKHVELNEFKSTLTLHVWNRLSWNDDKLKWNPSDYSDIKTINMADHEIWQPDVSIYNSAGSIAVAHYTTHCIVANDGQVLWVPPAQITSFCQLDLTYWPFDSQTCFLDVGSWTYNAYQINLTTRQNNYTFEANELHLENTEWTIINTKETRIEIVYECCPEPYVTLRFDIELKRISPSYKALVVTPTFAIVVLTLLSFWLPPQSGEKILLNGVTAVILTLFMLYFTQKIPAMGTHTPLIVLFYSASMYVVCFSLINSVVVIWMSRTHHMKPVPWFIKDVVMGRVGKLLGLSNYIQQSAVDLQRITAEEMRDHQVTDFEDQMSEDKNFATSMSSLPHQCDWIMLAAAIDRISFLFYSFLFIILAVTYSV